eukprot:1161720-Pelagomonas_calceolata.AAC.2
MKWNNVEDEIGKEGNEQGPGQRWRGRVRARAGPGKDGMEKCEQGRGQGQPGKMESGKINNTDRKTLPALVCGNTAHGARALQGCYVMIGVVCLEGLVCALCAVQKKVIGVISAALVVTPPACVFPTAKERATLLEKAPKAGWQVLSTCPGSELVGLQYEPLFPYFKNHASEAKWAVLYPAQSNAGKCLVGLTQRCLISVEFPLPELYLSA